MDSFESRPEPATPTHPTPTAQGADAPNIFGRKVPKPVARARAREYQPASESATPTSQPPAGNDLGDSDEDGEAASTPLRPASPDRLPPTPAGHPIADADGLPIPLPTWPVSAYSPVIAAAGHLNAEKLASSAVAPLVAYARGYCHVEETDAHTVAKTLRLGSANTRRYRAMVTILADGGGAMMMPRYKPAAARQYPEGGGKLPFVEIAEFRPLMAKTAPSDDPDKPGKPIKYIGVEGSAPVLDLHPATPPEWLDHTPVMLLTEGVLKGDSGLTALLRRAGISDEELSNIPDSRPAAVDLLRALMRRVPAELQTMIVSTGGVAAWHNNPEWNDLNLRGRRVWLAFDGDVAHNRNVWKQASQLWRYLEGSKKSTPVWLDLTRVGDDAGGKVQTGLDDHLTLVGPWQSLPSRLHKSLPPAPAPDATARRLVKGDLRMNDEDTTAEEWTVRDDGRGGQSGYWVPVVGITGRISKLISLREASEHDIEAGVIDTSPTAKTNVSIEVSYRDEDNIVQTHLIDGPDALLAEAPSEWHKTRVGAFVPSEVKAHPDWPPNLKWLQAVKGHRRDEIARPSQWQHMGWVPTAQPGSPVFIVGRQVVGRDGFNSELAIPGVDDELLSGATKFGVVEPVDADDLRRAIRTVFETYTHAWTDPRYAAAILAYALRAVVPLPSTSPGSFIGSRATAKALPLDTPIPVPLSERFPTGWARNRDLRLGDAVFAPDGTETVITNFSEIFADHPMVELTLADGQVVTSTDNHLWRVSDTYSRGTNCHHLRHHAAAVGRLQARVDELREMAASTPAWLGAPARDIARLAGLPAGHVTQAMARSGLPTDRANLPSGPPRKILVWPASEALRALRTHWNGPILISDDDADGFAGRWLSGRDLVEALTGRTWSGSDKDVLRSILRAANITCKAIYRQSIRERTVYPVGEALLMIAGSMRGLNRGLQPLEVVRTAAEIVETLATNPDVGFGIHRTSPVTPTHSSDLPVPGYTLGAWLGDGTTREGGFTSANYEVLDQIRDDGFVVTSSKHPKRPYSHYIRSLVQGLRNAEVLNNKHVPPTYLRASLDTRVAVLQGLMDTDGSCETNGGCSLKLTNRKLAFSSLELIRSLGIRCGMTTGPAVMVLTDPATGQKMRKQCGTVYKMHFVADFPVFRLADKLKRQQVFLDADSGSSKWIAIRSARILEPQESRCISVMHPSGQFLVYGFVPTHNSWSAAAAMAFWQHTPGTWHNKGLPGAATDTAASTELAVSRAPIWVVDDLAPGPDAKAEAMEARKLNEVIRSVANRTARRRANAEMGSQATHLPRSVLMVTTENNRFVGSVESRYLLLEFQRGALDSEWMRRLENLSKDSSDAAKLTFAALQMIASGSFLQTGVDTLVTPTWEKVVAEVKRERSSYEASAERLMPMAAGGSKRTWEVASDVCMGLWVLEQLCYVVGGVDDIGDQIYQMRNLIFSVSQQHVQGQSERSPGAAILAAVRATLAAGQAHIASSDSPGLPPVVGRDGRADKDASTLTAARLGWLPDGNGGQRPGGQNIGYLVHGAVKKGPDGEAIGLSDDPVVLLDAQNAFQISARHNRDMVMHGSTPTEAWKSAWNEELTCPNGDPYTRQKSNGHERVVVRALNQKLVGVPFRLSTILDTDPGVDPDEVD